MSKTKLELVRYGGVPSFVPRKKRPKVKSSNTVKTSRQTSYENTKRLILPEDTELLDNQVAGHMYEHGKLVGMLKSNDYVLKAFTKPMCGEREMRFYEELQSSRDPVLQEMKQFVPGYHGMKTIQINGNDVNCIVLDDVTKGLKEPCIMDIKIGRRTWDPLATEDKIKSENEKYKESKQQVGFCIPGFQVRNISDGKLYKHGKDYGKKLNEEGIRQTLKMFLNGENGFCRPLLVQLLGYLWRILHWCRNQRKIRLYSSSILIVYDARLLRYYNNQTNGIKKPVLNPKAQDTERLTRYKLNRPLSLSINHSKDEEIKASSPGFSGLFTSDGPKFERSLSANNAELPPVTTPPVVTNHWKKTLKKLQRNHSFNNNYEEELKNLKKNYVYMLDDLVGDTNNIWANVKMIDFAHVFPSEGNTLDLNYLEGIENLVKILEGFLEDCK